jgi:hypothetical protein
MCMQVYMSIHQWKFVTFTKLPECISGSLTYAMASQIETKEVSMSLLPDALRMELLDHASPSHADPLANPCDAFLAGP